MSKRVLFAEDDPISAKILVKILQDIGYSTELVSNGKQAVDAIKTEQKFDLIILDLNMPLMDGKQALKEIKILRPSIPVIIATADDNINIAVELIKIGASDFLVKPLNKERLEISISNAIKISQLSEEVHKLQNYHKASISFENIIGFDSGLKDVIKLAKKASQSDLPVLITGESGVGKELLARAIHGQSHRNDYPFVAINCGAISANLVESILFGHEKGAFTGAIKKYIGKFREAEKGTLFLDEIGDLPFELQVKLLRALQEQEITPLGSDQTIKINVRILAATNKNFEQEIKLKKFREDLYYRINVFPIHIPSLKDRKNDITNLIEHFIEKYNKLENKNIESVEKKALDYLINKNWPGNIRQLENFMAKEILLCEGQNITYEQIISSEPDIIAVQKHVVTSDHNDNNIQISLLKDNGEYKNQEDIMNEVINILLYNFNNDVKKVAKALNIGKSTIYRKLKENKNNAG